MVLVALALERRELPLDPPVLAREGDEPLELQPGGIEVQVRGTQPLEGDVHSICSLAQL